ncbi:MAG: hypothetical protein IPP14_01550 [Planctomycetes bacterium]|nr:hypothetical protein [Planctomycetota bacterium]
MLTPGCGEDQASMASQGGGENVIRVAESNDPRSIDPHKAGDTVSSQQCGMTYETLYEYDFFARPAKLVPCLAAGEAEYDPKTLTYIFTLRDDVYFQDDHCFHPDAAGKRFENESDKEKVKAIKARGRKLNAADFVYSIKRLAGLPDSGGFWVLENKIEGLDEFKDHAINLKGKGPQQDPDRDWYRYFDTPVSGLTVLDDLRFQVKLTEVYPQFLYAMTLSYGAAVAREAAEYYGDQLARNPVGTGPFMLDHWWEQKELVWVRNLRYRDVRFPASDDAADAMWKHVAGKRLPLADRMEYAIIKESQPQMLKFDRGELDATGMDKNQFTSAVTAQSELTDKYKQMGVYLRVYDEPTIHYIVYNMNDKTVGAPAGAKGLALRRAISLCLDRDDYIRRLLNKRGKVAGQIIPPGIRGHIDGYSMPSQRLDLQAARDILRKAGFTMQGSGEDWQAIDPDTGKQAQVTVLHRSNRDDTKDYAGYLNNAGKRIGVNIENDLLTFPEFLKRQDEGTGQAYDAGWVMDYPDSQNMLQLLYGPNRPPGINSAAYENAEYDQLYRDMCKLDDTVPEEFEKKMGLIKRMNAIIDQDVPWTLMEYRVTYSLSQGWFLPSKWKEPNLFSYTAMKYWSADRSHNSTTASPRETPVLPALILLTLLGVPIVLMGFRVVKNQS